MDGMEATTDLFINLIQNNRIIYDKSLKDFKNTRKKDEAWQNIAIQSRMTVESAKKRYASLRQKYSREKRNCEVRRRNKTVAPRYWVYYERLHFLDSFIQPRSTYTNDRFVEEDDDTMFHENEIDDPNEASGEKSKTINIEVEDGIEIEECGALCNDTQMTRLQDVDLQLETSRIDQTNTDHEQSHENILNCTERVVSEYSQEVSTVEYQSYENPIDATVGNMEIQQTSENCQLDGANTVDIDNYMSPHPGTSSMFRSPTIPPYPSRCYDPTTGEIVIARIERTVNTPRVQMSNNCQSQQHQSSSIQKATTTSFQPARSHQTIQPTTSSAATSFRSNQLKSTRRTNPPTVPTTSSTGNTVPSASALASASSKEKQIEAIRHRMENCLTAITNKVSDKAQRSPHGPFLSYLGTKLPTVPKENLPKLERDILDLVDQYAV